MTNDIVATAAVIMTGIVVAVIAWQVLAVARTAVARERHVGGALDDEVADLRRRLERLEAAEPQED